MNTINIAKYRKFSVVNEAVRWEGDAASAKAIVDWVCTTSGDSDIAWVTAGAHAGQLLIRIETLEGTMYANKGAWIIKGQQGEFYPVQDSIFQKTYATVERVVEDPQTVVDEQTEDFGLWFVAQSAEEEYLQAAIRRLHASIEDERL